MYTHTVILVCIARGHQIRIFSRTIVTSLRVHPRTEDYFRRHLATFFLCLQFILTRSSSCLHFDSILYMFQCMHYVCKLTQCEYFTTSSCPVIRSKELGDTVNMDPCPAKYLCSYCLDVPQTQVFGCFDGMTPISS